MTGHHALSDTAVVSGWLGTVAISAVGSAAWGFGLSWASTGVSGSFAAVNNATASGLTSCLLIFGGVVGDRHGQRALMLRCYTAYLVLLSTFALVWHLHLPVAAILLGYTVLNAVIYGFSSPSSSVFVRQLVPDDRVPHLMSISTTIGLLTRLAGPAVGAALIAWVGLTGSALIDAATDALAILVLWRIRPRYAPATHTRPRGRSLDTLVEGLRSIGSHADIRALLVTVAIFAGAVLPLSSLLIPLLAHQHGWTSAHAGILIMANTAGSLTTSAILALRGPYHRPIIPMVAGTVLAAAALIVFSLGLPLAPSAVCVYLCGLGIATLTMHMSPLFVLRTPRELQSRFQSLLSMTQLLPVMVTSLAFGPIAQHLGARTAILIAGILAAVALVPLLTNRDIRTAAFAPRARRPVPVAAAA
ncbi:MAG: MFS transporter [Propionibacteriaceae bacterium]|nr:MFS transporter [Propionibacteriaceae bacterium]